MNNKKRFIIMMAVLLITASFVYYALYPSLYLKSSTTQSTNNVQQNSIRNHVVSASISSEIKEEKESKNEAKYKKISAAKINSTKNTSIKSRGVILSTVMFPAQGVISSSYGIRWGTFHKGIDIAAPEGTNVYAFMAGTVTFSGWNSGGYGSLIIIDHGNGLETYYGHNSKLLVKKGQQVKKGQHIAEVGNTGRSTGPHIHFEIRKNGEPVDPSNYLK